MEMSSSGDPNHPTEFDMAKFFKPSTQNPFSSSSAPLPFYQNPPPFSQLYQNFTTAPQNPHNAGSQIQALLNSAPPQNPEAPPRNVGPPRLLSCKMPQGRRLPPRQVLSHDVDARLPGEAQPQLEVTPITKYGSDPNLVLGRQIAVNKSYICYGLKGGNIRVLNINTALRSLFRGHMQRVTDMAFFAEDVHILASVSVEGQLFVWNILEGPDDEDKAQITGKIVIAVKIAGDEEYEHPRVCWHWHKQEVLFVGIGKLLLRIDTTKVGKSEYSTDAPTPIRCPVNKLIDGIQLLGKHDGEVTDLSMCQWMITRLVSASRDGSIKIWEDCKLAPLAVLRPYDGQPVYSAMFLTSSHKPDHTVLITGGPLNKELKLWSSANEEGWLLPSDADSWTCTQTLELKSSSNPKVEEAFFNQVISLPQAGLVLLANGKRNAIYVVHLEYGSCPATTRMDYISEFTVTMPILSFTAATDPPDKNVVKVYCVQTQAIQQYALELCQCVPPPLETVGIEESDSGVSHDQNKIEELDASGPSLIRHQESVLLGSFPMSSMLVHGPEDMVGIRYPATSSLMEATTTEDIQKLNVEAKVAALTPSASDSVTFTSPQSTPTPRLPSNLSGFGSQPDSLEPISQQNDQRLHEPAADYLVNRQIDDIQINSSDVPLTENGPRSEDKKISSDVLSGAPGHLNFKHPTHLVTPSEILMAAASSEVTNINEGKTNRQRNTRDLSADKGTNNELEVKVVDEATYYQNHVPDSHEEPQRPSLVNKERCFSSQASDLGVKMTRGGCAVPGDSCAVQEHQQAEHAIVSGISIPHVNGEEIHQSRKDVTVKCSEASRSTLSQSPAPNANGKKNKGNYLLGTQSSPLSSGFDLTNSSNVARGSLNQPAADVVFPQIIAMQDMINQLLSKQKELQKQMSNVVNLPVTKEGRRLEAALGRNIEKAFKANTDALWARFQEENGKNEKMLQDHTQQINSLITNLINKDLATILEKTVKKELTSVGTNVVRAIIPTIEKTIASAIAESFQRGIGDKAVNQLEKSVTSKLETTVARQIQAQFQTSGRVALQDALKSSLESLVMPAFEMSCKAMFEQVDAFFQKGMVEHTNAAQQHFDSTHSSLALALRDSINSASAIAQTLGGELADGQRKVLAIAAANSTSDPNLFHKVEVPVDPVKEFSRLISQHKYDEAFTVALQRSDASMVSWLCSQVDLRGILAMVPLPLSQGVLLSLLQQLGCDINKDMQQKLDWMTEVASAIEPSDQMIAVHVKLIFEQVYQTLHHLHSSVTLPPTDHTKIRLLMHVINSVLTSCK